MKRLISSLVVALAFVLMSSGTALAEHYWKLEMFRPTGAITGNSFTIEYKVLSVEKNDDFTIKLFQNGVDISTQNTTKDYGDSGVFTVTVPGPGTYNYHVRALSSIDGSTKATEDRTLTVSETPSGTVTTVFVNQANTASSDTAGGQASGTSAGGGGAGAGAASGGAGGTDGAGDTGGDVAGATIGPDGQVNAPGESATDKEGEEQGSANKDGDDDSSDWLWWLLAAIAAAGAAGYYYVQRTGINPFNRTSE